MSQEKVKSGLSALKVFSKQATVQSFQHYSEMAPTTLLSSTIETFCLGTRNLPN
ncbi:MAG: hypothetical protein CLLPBCKN_007480 [Chroococcidiopsis cubana SAG 39.79]|nr:hypothetical protein [Chroococcidiopsis cubana SAG 39.79]